MHTSFQNWRTLETRAKFNLRRGLGYGKHQGARELPGPSKTLLCAGGRAGTAAAGLRTLSQERGPLTPQGAMPHSPPARLPPCTGGSVKPPTARPPGARRVAVAVRQARSTIGPRRAGPPSSAHSGPAGGGGGAAGDASWVVAAPRPMSAPGAVMEAGRPGGPGTLAPLRPQGFRGGERGAAPALGMEAPLASAAAAPRSLQADSESCVRPQCHVPPPGRT